jgi:uncharacterized protein YqkB
MAMNVTWSDEAVRALRSRLGSDDATVKLVYDIEGCGCAVDGVPALWAVDRLEPDDVPAEGSAFPLWHKRQQEIFFEPELRIGYLEEKRAFTLSSDNQIYTNRLALVDQRENAAGR